MTHLKYLENIKHDVTVRISFPHGDDQVVEFKSGVVGALKFFNDMVSTDERFNYTSIGMYDNSGSRLVGWTRHDDMVLWGSKSFKNT